MLLSAKNILLHTYPFVFIDEYKILDFHNIYGEVCFDSDKYSYQHCVDLCDLIESSGQLCGVHIAKNFNGSNGMAGSGYLSKIYQAKNFSNNVWKKNTKFKLQATFVESLDNYFVYSIKVFHYETADLVLETKLGVMLADSLSTNTSKIEQKFIGSNNDDIFSMFEQENDCIKISFNKHANFFEGHFNNYPIVPGIYLVKSATIAIGKFYHPEKNINSLKELVNCKFNNLVLPQEEVVMMVNKVKEGNFGVRIISKQNNQLKCGFSLLY